MCQPTSTPSRIIIFWKVQNQNTSRRYAYITKTTTDQIITINHSLQLKTTHRPRIIAIQSLKKTSIMKIIGTSAYIWKNWQRNRSPCRMIHLPVCYIFKMMLSWIETYTSISHQWGSWFSQSKGQSSTNCVSLREALFFIYNRHFKQFILKSM